MWAGINIALCIWAIIMILIIFIYWLSDKEEVGIRTPSVLSCFICILFIGAIIGHSLDWRVTWILLR